MEASFDKCGAFIKISIIFEDFFREIEAFSRIARLFNYIFSGKEAISSMSLWPFGPWPKLHKPF
jgi:hypothetical protein